MIKSAVGKRILKIQCAHLPHDICEIKVECDKDSGIRQGDNAREFEDATKHDLENPQDPRI